MELTLVVRSGDAAGKRFTVPTGGGVDIGRGAPADVVVPDDPMLSNPHFRIENGDVCLLKDLGSRFGTIVNGQKVTEATIRDGDEVQAGQTVFRIAVQQDIRATPAIADEDRPTESHEPLPVSGGRSLPVVIDLPPRPAAVVVRLRSLPMPLFGLFDAAREPGVVNRLKESGQECSSLYDGVEGEQLAPFGPWLVRLPPGATLLDELVRDGWGKSWGVYLTCVGELAEVRRHLRKFLIVKLPDAREVYFRFYDPRVLRTYLPTCTPDDLAAFFGPIGRYAVEGVDGDELLEYAVSHRDWQQVGLPK